VNSKVRFIPLIVLGAIILSLIAVIPAFSDTGKLRFWDVTDTDEDQEWARSGGMVHLEVDDSDLDVPVKYVILPNELMMVGTVTGMLGDTVTTATSTAVAVGDTVLVEGNTIREVTDVSADGETLTLNRPVADGSSGALYEVVSDAAKLNVDDCEACAPAQMEMVTGLGYINLDNAPVADSGVGDNLANRFSGDGDSRTNSHDVRLVDMDGEDLTGTMYEVQQVSNSEDRVELSAAAAHQMVYVVYWGSSKNDTGSTVDVRSSADSEGITVVLTETNASSGVFRGYIELTAEDSNEAMGRLRVNPSGSVTLRYDDDGTRRTKAIEVETTRPVLSNFSPAHNSASQNDRPEVMVDVTDSDSGIDDADVFVVFAVLDDNEVMGGDMMARSVSVDEDGRLRSITDGERGEQRLPDELRITSGDSTVAWWVVAEDMAGNSAVSDQNTDSDSPCDPDMFPGLDAILSGDYGDDPVGVDDLSGKAVGDDFDSGCQPFIVKVDDTDPTLMSATTGSFWDTGSDDDDKTNMDRTAAKPTSIRLDFSEKLDGSSVSASDFEVDGNAPLDAAHYSGASMYVFLTVPALDPHDKPKVGLVGEVSDPAGNTANSGTTGDDDGGPTHDGIAPTLTVTLEGVMSGDRPVTDKEIKITVETDENTSNPSVMITKVGAVNADGKGLLRGTMVTKTPKVKSPRVYETTWDTSTAGLYNIYVTASDGSGNGDAGASGMMMVTDDMGTADDDSDDMERTVDSPVDLSSDTSLLFEVDNSGPEFSLNPEESDDPNAFIQVEFSGEGNEYMVPVMGPGADGYTGGEAASDDTKLDADGMATTDADEVDMDDLDSYAMVTILSATLAGDDISDALERLGDSSFLFAAPDLAVGEYKITIDAEDSAGNDMESEMTLKITERKPFSLNIRAGVSLISFPGDPVDPDINAVFPMDHPVQEIATYDPSQPGKWFASQRDENTGMLDGNLLTISGNQAYLVRSESSKSLSVVISRPSAHDPIPPPQIDLVKGWNLVPVLDVTYGLADGDAIGYMTYFGDNSNIDRVYGVDTIRNRLVLVESDDDLMVGKGYWVFASSATSVAPGTAADDE
jgi:hypothetical protein